MTKGPLFSTSFYYGVKDKEKFARGRDTILDAMNATNGTFASDNLIALARNLGFLDDQKFMTAWRTHAKEVFERGIIWRTANLVWAARQALRLPEGDFVECGCYKGVTARIVADTVDFADTGRKYYLYDLFEHDATMPHHAMPEHGPDLFEQTQQRFADMPSVIVTKGWIPQSFEQAAPERISFLHIDLNNAEAEIAALEVLFDRVVPGGIIIFDDFGCIFYRKQFLAETKWFAERGYSILEMPTGQGMVLK